MFKKTKKAKKKKILVERSDTAHFNYTTPNFEFPAHLVACRGTESKT
jgi:hypothetical protein